jgi:hypothetical protein
METRTVQPACLEIARNQRESPSIVAQVVDFEHLLSVSARRWSDLDFSPFSQNLLKRRKSRSDPGQ